MNEEPQASVAAEPTGSPTSEIQWGEPAPAVPVVPETPAPATPTEPAAPVEPEPVNSDFTFSELQNGEKEIKLASGQVYRGKSEREVLEKVALAQVEASRHIQRLSAPPPPAPTPQPAAPTLPPESLALLDLVAPALGAKDAQDFIARQTAQAQQMAQFQEMYQQMQFNQQAQSFLAEVGDDFPNTKANADRLGEIITQYGLSDDAKGLKAAHYIAKGQGLYEAIRPAPPRAENGQFAPRSNVMPMPPHSSTPTPAPTEADPFGMTDDQFNQYMSQRRA